MVHGLIAAVCLAVWMQSLTWEAPLLGNFHATSHTGQSFLGRYRMALLPVSPGDFAF